MANQTNSVEKPKKGKIKKFIRNILIIGILLLAGLVYFYFYFPFGRGVKAGQLNYVVHKGYIFKTYEGKLIQAGFRGNIKQSGNAVQSYEFEFSVTNKEIAEKLMLMGGKEMQLHYTEYLGALPWRGYNKCIVDEIIEIQ